MKQNPFTFDRTIRILIGLALIVLMFFAVRRLSSVLLPFLIAWFIAYLLQPIVRFFQFKLKLKSRVLSVVCTLFLFLGCLGGIIWFLTPIISNEITKLSQLIVSYSQGFSVDTFLPPVWQNEIRRYLSHLNLQTVLQNESIMSGVKRLVPELWNIVNGSLDFLLGLTVVIIVILYLIFILIDYEKISADLYNIIPPKYRSLLIEIIKDLETSMNRYFRGQALVALIVGILFSIGFSIIELPLAILLGVMIGVLTMVPYLKVIMIIPSIALGFFQSVQTGQSFGSVLLGLAIVYLIVQVFEDVILVPKIMGKVTGLNPAVILLSLSIWGSLMGMVGMIIALPLTTLIISYYKRYVLKNVDSNINDRVEESVEN